MPLTSNPPTAIRPGCARALFVVLLVSSLSARGTAHATSWAGGMTRTEAEETKTEQLLGNRLHRDLMAVMTPVFDEAVVGAVREIGDSVVVGSSRAGQPFKFYVINDPTVNAYSQPDGYVYVTTGLLDVLKDRDELAAIIGHEVAHVCEKHMEKQIRMASGLSFALQVLGSVGGGVMAAGAGGGITGSLVNNAAQSVIGGIGGFMAQAMIMGYGREQELDADKLGMTYLKQSGRDPEAFVRALEALEGYEKEARTAGIPVATKLINARPGLEERLQIAQKLAAEPAPAGR